MFSTYAQEERNLDPFDKLTVTDNIILRLVNSDREYALIDAEGIDASSVRTLNTENNLKIEVYGNLFVKRKVTITLFFKNLKSIEVTNGADVSTSSLYIADSLFVELKSGGMFYLDADIEYLNVRAVEGSIFSGEGYATIQDFNVASTATISAFELEGDVVTVRAATGATAKIYAEEELNAQSLSRAYISYKGEPKKVNITTSGGGTIEVSED